MSKFDYLEILKQVKARTDHFCSFCGNRISKGDAYYRERLDDAFLHTSHARKFCAACYDSYGDRLLKD